jgi:hypothetical protein
MGRQLPGLHNFLNAAKKVPAPRAGHPHAGNAIGCGGAEIIFHTQVLGNPRTSLVFLLGERETRKIMKEAERALRGLTRK